MMMNRIRKGARVMTSGRGRTATWDPFLLGAVLRRRGASVLVLWEDGSESEMSLSEVLDYCGRG